MLYVLCEVGADSPECHVIMVQQSLTVLAPTYCGHCLYVIRLFLTVLR